MEVKDFVPERLTVNELVRQFRYSSFSARKLANAVDILETMIKDRNCVKFLGLSGALTPAGMRACVTEMIKNKWVDIIVSTGANITHDLACCFGEKYIQCDPEEANDSELRRQKASRIYDIISPDKTSMEFEKNIQRILKEIGAGEFSSYEIMNEIGKRISNKSSIVRMASDNGVKIIIPAFFDSIFGIQTWMYSQDHRLVINEGKDIDYLINLHYKLKDEGKNSGVFVLGGGVPKNFILQSVLIAEKPHKYVVQVTTDTPQYGGLSGATLEEARSWGKVDDNSKLCVVYCDSTIALPLIVSALKERL